MDYFEPTGLSDLMEWAARMEQPTTTDQAEGTRSPPGDGQRTRTKGKG